jgi:DNA-binding response OmpR family regulator
MAYAMCSGTAERVMPEEMLMTRPPSGMNLRAFWIRRNGALAFTVVMRRVRHRQPAARIITYGSLRIDADTRETRVNGRRVELTRKEFDLLHLLASQPGAVFSRRQLMTQVWDDAWSRQGRTLDTHVSSLRGKLGSSSWVVTIRGVGFRLGHP